MVHPFTRMGPHCRSLQNFSGTHTYWINTLYLQCIYILVNLLIRTHTLHECSLPLAIKRFKNWESTSCFQARGAPHHRHFIQNTSKLQEVGGVIKKISTFRILSNLLELFLGPYPFIKRFKNIFYL